ncbi:MAG TPA: hypothetical protein VGQ03_00540 [Nitrososphaera sp.]|jgi:hypothetical protein|nr:hypothetical protein [Nitrososphaera sp.]
MTELTTTVFATNIVLERLGKEVAEILKKYLHESFSICLEPDCLFAVEELGIAVQRLLGADVAKRLMQDIRDEVEDLSSMQKPATRQKNNNLSFWRVE